MKKTAYAKRLETLSDDQLKAEKRKLRDKIAQIGAEQWWRNHPVTQAIYNCHGDVEAIRKVIADAEAEDARKTGGPSWK